MASNTYIDMSELIKDYYDMPVGSYLNRDITVNEVSLTCDIYRVQYGTALTSSIFTGCTDVDANTQIIIGMNMSVANGTTLTPPYRCKGLFIGDKGVFTNNGIISMTARGASGEGQDIQLTTDYLISAVGGSANSSPTSGILSCAGGGDGGYYPTVDYMSARGIGGTGTSFSGGSGGGGSGASTDKAGNGSSTGGAGGNGFCSKSTNASGGGGAGNPGGLPDTGGTGTATAGSNGTGGLCVIFASTIVSTGSLESTGSAGGDASSTNPLFSSSGGGSGGGCIVLFSSEFNITGTHSVAGGQAGTASGAGAGNPGGNGVYATFTVNDFSLDLDVEFVLTDSTHLDNIDPSDKVRFIGLLDADEFAYDALGTRHHIVPGSGSGGSGHAITDGTTNFTQRTKLEFDAPLTVADDSTNGATKIGVETGAEVDFTDFEIPFGGGGGSSSLSAGNGISIADNTISVNKGNGLKIDNNGKLRVDYENVTNADYFHYVSPNYLMPYEDVVEAEYNGIKFSLDYGKITASGTCITNEATFMASMPFSYHFLAPGKYLFKAFCNNYHNLSDNGPYVTLNFNGASNITIDIHSNKQIIELPETANGNSYNISSSMLRIPVGYSFGNHQGVFSFMLVDAVNQNETTKTATLSAGSTSVTFSNIPTSGDYLFTLYTDKAGLEYKTVDDSVSGQITYTFDAQSSAVTCRLLMKEV